MYLLCFWLHKLPTFPINKYNRLKLKTKQWLVEDCGINSFSLIYWHHCIHPDWSLTPSTALSPLNQGHACFPSKRALFIRVCVCVNEFNVPVYGLLIWQTNVIWTDLLMKLWRWFKMFIDLKLGLVDLKWVTLYSRSKTSHFFLYFIAISRSTSCGCFT